MGTLLRPTAFSHRYLCGFLAALMACGPALPLAAQERQPSGPSAAIGAAQDAPVGDTTLLADPAVAPADLNLRYTLPNACVVVAARPAQIFRSPMLELMPIEVMQAAVLQEFNVDVLTLDQVVISAAPPIQGPPTYAVYGEFSAPAKLHSAQLERLTEEAEFAGRTYRRSPGAMEPSVYQPTDRGVLLTPDATLRQLVSADTPPLGPLAAEVAAAAKTDDLFAVVDVETLRPLINMGLAQVEAPPELHALLDLPNLVKRAELRVNLSNPGVTELVATANSADDAQAIVDIVDGLKDQVRQKVAEQTAKLATSSDPVQRAQGRYMQRMTAHWDEALQLQVDGDRLIVFRVDPSESGADAQLVYIATIGILVALLLPAVQAAREAARRNVSVNNLKQIMLALLNYHDSRRSFPAQANYDADGKPLLSWRVHILPYLEQQALYAKFHLDEPWDSEHNKQLIPLMPEVYLDPSSPLDASQGLTHYLGVAGDGYAFATSGKGNGLRQFRDGTSNTIAVVQVNDEQAVPWTKPADYTPPEGNPLADWGRDLHPGGFHVAFSDGSVQYISNFIDPDLFRSLLTIAGGEVVNGF